MNKKIEGLPTSIFNFLGGLYMPIPADLDFCNFPNCESCDRKRENCNIFKKFSVNIKNFKQFLENRRERTKEGYRVLKKMLGNKKPNIFSFGCGVGADYLGANEIFNNDFNYFGIDDSCHIFRETKAFKAIDFLPNIFSVNSGIFLLEEQSGFSVVCFFNSLSDMIKQNNQYEKIFSILTNKNEFIIIFEEVELKNSSVGFKFLEEFSYKNRNEFEIEVVDFLVNEGIAIHFKRKDYANIS